jgi:hypothetical protein
VHIVNFFLIIISLLLTLPTLKCTTEIAGGTSVSGNGVVMGKIMTNDGTPAPFTKVMLLPSEFNPVENDAGITIDTTDTNGNFYIEHVVPGSYTITAKNLKSRTRLAIFSIPVTQDTSTIPTGTLLEPGSIAFKLSGALDTNGYIYIPGTEFFRKLSGCDSLLLDSVPAGSVPAIYYSSGDSHNREILRYNVPVVSGTATGITNTEWPFFRKVYFNTTGNGVGITRQVTDVPILLRLDRNNFDFSQTDQYGTDIKFTNSNNDVLNYEIEGWDTTNLEAAVWIRVDTIAADNNSQFILMYWGASSSSATSSLSNSAKVFDTAIGFQGVWHQAEVFSRISIDATPNYYNGIYQNMFIDAVAPGMIGIATKFDGVDDFIEYSSSATGKLNFLNNEPFTLSAWVYADTIDNFTHQIVTKGTSQYGLQLNKNKWEMYTVVDSVRIVTSIDAVAKKWVLLTGVFDGTRPLLYIDGVAASSTTQTSPSIRISDQSVTVGSSFSQGKAGEFWLGIIDEVRISDVARSADWIKLVFMNQRNPDVLIQYK